MGDGGGCPLGSSPFSVCILLGTLFGIGLKGSQKENHPGKGIKDRYSMSKKNPEVC